MKAFRELELMILQYIYIYLEMRIYLVMNIRRKFDIPIDTREVS